MLAVRQLSKFFVLSLILAEVPLVCGKDVGSTQGNFVVRGELICLDQSGKESPCRGKADVVALKANDGKLYRLQMEESVETLLNEKRVRTKTFQLTLRQTENRGVHEIITSQFVRDGKVYDFHYFCEVCNIKTYAPGLCMCCREEMEYRESVAD